MMTFLAAIILGVITYFTLPISLLPDISIPEITVQLSAPNSSARQLENTVVRPMRQQLLQVAHLSNIESRTRDGQSIIRMRFSYGTDTDYTFIEVNEKIDAAMNNFPKDMERPRVIKASATDLPVFNLNLTLKNERPFEDTDNDKFLELSDFASSVIKRRLEQLPEVAMVDVTGIESRQLSIIPNEAKLTAAGITLDELEQVLENNNVDPRSMTIQDGYYEYNVKFSSVLRSREDVENIYLKKNGRIYRLADLTEIIVSPEKAVGYSYFDGKRSIVFSVIKQTDASMQDMKKSVAQAMENFEREYPNISFDISQNQTELLDFTLSNLQSNLWQGLILICLISVLFFKDIRTPSIISLGLIVALIISMLFYYLFGLSLNIISLSGLILALGMMIDSSIIVTENIAQYRAKGDNLEEACIKGTTEVITPMLSSTFTTIAVFVPLVFMSGIAGAIFFDQAFAVTVGLMVSYFTGIMLLPVLYKLVYSIPEIKHSFFNLKINNLIKEHTLDRFYDGGVDFIFRHKTTSLLFVAVTIPLCAILFYMIPKSRMPEIDQNELIAHVEWNENIHIDENRKRVTELFGEADRLGAQHTAYIGQQQFLLNRDRELSISEVELYFKTEETDAIAPLQQEISAWVKRNYPTAVLSFSPPETVFEKLFVTGEADIVAEFYARNKEQAPDAPTLQKLEKTLESKTGLAPVGVAFENQLNISIDHQKLLLYNISYEEVYRVLKTAFKENEVATLRSYQQYLPITLAGNEQTVDHILHNTLIRTQPDENQKTNHVPLSAVTKITPGEDLKILTAGKNGEYIPFSFYQVENAEQLMENIRELVRCESKDKTNWDIDFSGSFFSNQQMLNELVVILFISILLMYFILAAQFESFLQPLIVLLEIPIDVAASLLILWICGHTLNLMSAIGIVVTCGIIINDSILKLDAINELRKEGVPLMEAIHEAGRRRLRPIIMTSLTTIFGMVPLLFTFDMGSELQKPLSIAMISAMLIGTVVSLFIIPLVYWFIYRRHAL